MKFIVLVHGMYNNHVHNNYIQHMNTCTVMYIYTWRCVFKLV